MFGQICIPQRLILNSPHNFSSVKISVLHIEKLSDQTLMTRIPATVAPTQTDIYVRNNIKKKKNGKKNTWQIFPWKSNM